MHAMNKRVGQTEMTGLLGVKLLKNFMRLSTIKVSGMVEGLVAIVCVNVLLLS